MQQTPQDPNQQFPSSQPSSHQGFVPDPAYAANESYYGDPAAPFDFIGKVIFFIGPG